MTEKVIFVATTVINLVLIAISLKNVIQITLIRKKAMKNLDAAQDIYKSACKELNAAQKIRLKAIIDTRKRERENERI